MRFSDLKRGLKFLLPGDNRIYIRENGPNGNNARMIGTRTYIRVLSGMKVKVVR